MNTDGQWHKDPLQTHQWRWWDGRGWTDLTADTDLPPTDPPAGAVSPPPPPPPPSLSVPSSSKDEPSPVRVVGLSVPGASTAISAARSLWETRRPLVLAVGALLLIVLTLVVTSSTKAHTITGTITLTDSDGFDTRGERCSGTGGYGDMDAGTPVTVRDGTGQLVGSSSLEPGSTSLGGMWCELPFAVTDVKRVDFYEIEVGRRGSLSYSFDEIQRNDWTVGFSLGD